MILISYEQDINIIRLQGLLFFVIIAPRKFQKFYTVATACIQVAVRVWGIFARTSVIVFSQKWNETCEELCNSKTLGKSEQRSYDLKIVRSSGREIFGS